MASKIDSEALKKNAFWITLGAFGVVWLAALLIVWLGASDKRRKDWEAAKGSIDKALASGPKTEAYLAPWKAHGKDFREHKDKIWADGWSVQKDLYTWPEDMKVVPSYPEDPFGASDREELNNRGAFPKQYSAQFTSMPGIVAPALFRAGFDAVVPRQPWVPNKPPTREEIWLAQESFWVRREMLMAVQDALNASALFTDLTVVESKGTSALASSLALPSRGGPAGEAMRVLAAFAANPPSTRPPVTLPEGVLASRVFRSAYWEVTLMFSRSTEGTGTKWVISPESTIKNVNRTRKTQYLASSTSPKGVPFRLIAADGATYVMRIAGEPLAHESSTTAPSMAKLNRTYIVDPVNLKEPFAFQQVLEWETSPIRMIDAVEIAAHSHRTITWGLKINPELKKLDPDAAPEPPAGMKDKGMPKGAGPGGNPPTGNPPTGMPKDAMAKGGKMPGAPVENTRVNSISRLRYMHITPQCKHIPVALRLVVDQAHIHDVLAAVSNSPLRIQITQVTFRHNTSLTRAEGHAKPGAPKSEDPVGDGFIFQPPKMGRAGRTAIVHADDTDFSGGVRKGEDIDPIRMKPKKPRTTTHAEEGEDVFGGKVPTGEVLSKVPDEAQLVDLEIYGVATLYERFPPRPKGTPPAKK